MKRKECLRGLRTSWGCLLYAALAGAVPLAGSLAAADQAGTSATHVEAHSIGSKTGVKFGSLSTFCLNQDGNLLACDMKKRAIIVVSPNGERLATWKLRLTPQAIHVHTDGTVFIGGMERLAKLDQTGKLLKSVGSPTRERAAGIATTRRDLFVALRKGFGFSIYRFDHNLEQPKEIVEHLRGCCGQMDVAAKDGLVYVAENARHEVVCLDREGKELRAWGKYDRHNVEGFGSCCNPMNLFFGPGGALYTSEAELGRVKRYTPDGKFLGLVGEVKIGAGCVNVSIAVRKDGSRVYVLDRESNLIRVLQRK